MRWVRIGSLMGVCSVVSVAGCGPAFSLCASAPSSASSSGGAGTGGSPAITGTGGAGGAPDAGSGGAGGHPLHHDILVLNQFGKRMTGVPLVVNDSSGAVVTTTQTDLWGSAVLVVPDSGSVSAFYNQDLEFSVTTFIAPPDATSIAFTINQRYPAAAPVLATTYLIATSQLPVGTTAFTCFNACQVAAGDLGTGACQVTTAGCSPSTVEDLMVVAYAGSQPLGWGGALRKPTSPGDTLAFATAVGQPVATLSAMVTDIPAGANDASLTVFSGTSPSLGLPAKFVYDHPGASITSSFNVLAGGESTVWVHEQVDLGGMDSGTFLSRDRSYQSPPATTTFSAASMALVSVSPLHVHDPAHPVVSWSVGDGSRGDVGSATIQWHAGTSAVSYTVFFPPDGPTALRVPDVPPELASYAPVAGNQFDRTVVGYVDYEAIDDYAGVVLEVGNPALFPVVDGLGTVRSFGASTQIAP